MKNGKVPKMTISYLHVIRFQMETKNSAQIIDFKIVTMLLEEKIYMLNNFDTDNQCFQKWKHISAPIICMKMLY